MLSMLNIDMHRVVEPGDFELMVGPSSDKTSSVLLTVVGTNGETGRPPLPPAPAGSESGMVSTFDDGKVAANYGSWIPAGDSMNGGVSKSTLQVTESGANGTKGALQVDGEIIIGQPIPFHFAGALYFPAAAPMQPANLSAKKEISFWAKGDGKTYTLIVLTEARNGSNGAPAMTSFVAGPAWKQYTFPFSTFETNGSDLTGLGFVHVEEPGKFQFQIDQLEIK
jgi:complex I intermediate-associated protein 30 (CIA30)